MKRFRLDRANLIGLGFILGGLAIYLWAVQRGWDLPPTDAHNSRQAQTAITAQMLHEDGFSTLTPFNGLGPPWSVPMEFPTYQILVAAVAGVTNGDVITSGRLVGVLGTFLLVAALGLILRRADLDLPVMAAGIAILLTAPLWIIFSRAILIESFAAALAAWWLAGLLETLSSEQPNRKWIVTTLLLGVMAALTKVTSFAVVLPAGAIVTWISFRRHGRSRLIGAGLVTLPGILAAVLWNGYADAVKQAHPYANFLTSENLSAWNWGTISQRLDPAWWSRIFQHLNLIFPWWWWGIIAAGAAVGSSRQRSGIALSVIVLGTGPLAFANLYYVHNYYLMAVAPAAVVAMTLSLAALKQRWSGSPPAMASLVLGCIVLIGLQVMDYRDGLGRGQVRNRPLPEFGLLVNELTQPDDRILIIGQEWDPLLTYTINRPLAFVRENYETDEDAWRMSREAMQPDDYTVLIATNAVAGDTKFIHYRCRELGLMTEPVASTANADIYVSRDTKASLEAKVTALRESGSILPRRPDRMGPGESRLEFIAADWTPFDFAKSGELFSVFQPLPDAVFTRHAPAPMTAFDREVLHVHPPGGMRFKAFYRDRTIRMSYGLKPDIWENEHDSDGVRFRFFSRGPDGRQRLVWSDFVTPLSNPDHRKLQQVEHALPAGHELELWIDAGPDHNPGYDWSIIANMSVQ